MSKEKKNKLLKSVEYKFYQLIFCNIEEKSFKVLYSANAPRPNAPINVLVSALILKNRKDWSFNELIDNIDFNIKTRAALGLFTLQTTPFCRATIFNFQNRCFNHYVETGEDLLGQVFHKLSKKQLKSLNISTDIQRGDSFLLHSNIRNYSRLQLLIEVVLRIYRKLSYREQKQFRNKFNKYSTQKTSNQLIYSLDKDGLSRELIDIVSVYNYIMLEFYNKYKEEDIFQIFFRVYTEHFELSSEKLELKPNERLNGGMLQSPDDFEATYRKKGKKSSKGFVVHINETCNPGNQLNLLTDIFVESNNVDDSKILESNLVDMKKSSPDLNEYHTDGAYSSVSNDNLFENFNIMHIPTSIRGRNSDKLDLKISKSSDGNYILKCPNQEVFCEKCITRFKGEFCLEKCSICEVIESCPTVKNKKYRVFYFTDEYYLKEKRRKNIKNLPAERKNLRANIEASVKEFRYKKGDGKLKVRGKFKAMVYAVCNGIYINFGRIHRYLCENVLLDKKLCNV